MCVCVCLCVLCVAAQGSFVLEFYLHWYFPEVVVAAAEYIFICLVCVIAFFKYALYEYVCMHEQQ